jgi:hypothetical protein
MTMTLGARFLKSHAAFLFAFVHRKLKALEFPISK